MRLRGAVLHGDDVARLRRGRPGRRAARLPLAPAPLRRPAGGGGGMTAVSEQTRLGLEILGASTALGIAGDALLRATPWGLNALLCTAGLVVAAAWIVRRRRIAVSGEAELRGAGQKLAPGA